MMQVIDGSFTPLPEAVGEIVAFDMVHGWHFQPYVDWEKIGAGAKLYTAAQLTAFAKEVARKSHLAPTQGADARPVAMDEARELLIEVFARRLDLYGSGDDLTDRIRTYLATRDAAPSDAQIIGWWDSVEASGFRWKEGIVRNDFSNGTPIYAAVAPMEKT